MPGALSFGVWFLVGFFSFLFLAFFLFGCFLSFIVFILQIMACASILLLDLAEQMGEKGL